MAFFETLLRNLKHWKSQQCCAFQFPGFCNNNNNNNNNMAYVQICEAEVTIWPFTLGS